MRAESCYQATKANVLPLVLLTQNDCSAGFDAFSNAIKIRFQLQQFQGRLGDFAIVDEFDGQTATVFVGSGDGNIEQALAMAALRLPEGNYCAQQPLSHTAKVIWSLAQYRFDRYKSCGTSPRVLTLEPSDAAGVIAMAQAIYLVRDLINTPANDLGPSQMAACVANLAHKYNAQFEQWVGEALLRDNFPAIFAVGKAASDKPRLLSLTWGNEQHPRVTLIGKGVCFDSGGLNIKPAQNMRLMKKDMGGAAQVLGLAQWIMSVQLPIRLQVFIPAVENAISSESYRPGDVLKMRNGLTVEIDNTDAEGRLVLADALVKACEEKPELLIDFATLTGAARVAVGTDIAAMFSNDDDLAQKISVAAVHSSDPVWRLPLFNGYMSLLDSSIADMTNSSATSYAGAITAALFLQRFVSPKIAWMHFDVMAWNPSSKPGKPEGGEAMGIQALAHYLKERYSG